MVVEPSVFLLIESGLGPGAHGQDYQVIPPGVEGLELTWDVTRWVLHSHYSDEVSDSTQV